MKRFYIVVIMFVIATFFVIGNKQDKLVNNETSDLERRAIFISYIELGEYIKGVNSTTSKNNIITMLDNISRNNFNMILLHTRPFSDAIYNSSIYPSSRYVTSLEGRPLDYDILSFFIEESHKRNIEVHAWVNPYRVRNTTSTSDISVSNPAYKYLGTNHVKIIEGKGIFYNPASSKVRELIISGIEEIVLNYDIDGIHFDDYFYPDDSIDLENYEEYVSLGGTLTLSDYRLNNVSILVKDVYDKIKSIKKDVLFGISPEGNINNNYSDNYVDTKMFLSTEGYLDYIMPQVYFGFNHETMPFIDVIDMWNSLIKVEGVKLIPALALYKSGEVDNYARSGKNEWIDNTDIIKRQVLTSRNVSNYGGFSIFRYDYLFDIGYSNDNLLKEKENLLEVIK